MKLMKVLNLLVLMGIGVKNRNTNKNRDCEFKMYVN